jgi:hypothetical protein
VVPIAGGVVETSSLEEETWIVDRGGLRSRMSGRGVGVRGGRSSLSYCLQPVGRQKGDVERSLVRDPADDREKKGAPADGDRVCE